MVAACRVYRRSDKVVGGIEIEARYGQLGVPPEPARVSSGNRGLGRGGGLVLRPVRRGGEAVVVSDILVDIGQCSIVAIGENPDGNGRRRDSLAAVGYKCPDVVESVRKGQLRSVRRRRGDALRHGCKRTSPARDVVAEVRRCAADVHIGRIAAGVFGGRESHRYIVLRVNFASGRRADRPALCSQKRERAGTVPIVHSGKLRIKVRFGYCGTVVEELLRDHAGIY